MGCIAWAGLAGKISQLLSEEANSEVEGCLTTARKESSNWLTLPCPSP